MSKTKYINLTTEDVTALILQVEDSSLLLSAKQTLVTIIRNYTWLQLKLEQGKVSFKILREILLGFKSEKNKSQKKNLNALANNLLLGNKQQSEENQPIETANNSVTNESKAKTKKLCIPCGIIKPYSISKPLIWFAIAVLSCTNKLLILCKDCKSCCFTVFGATNLMLGLTAASLIASASLRSFLLVFTKGFTNWGSEKLPQFCTQFVRWMICKCFYEFF